WIAPAARMRSTIGASSAGTLSAKSRVPNVVRTPLVITRSLVENGTPCSGPSVAPFFIIMRSAARASLSAWSAVSVTKALSRGLRRSMRASTAFTTSTGETLRRLMAGAIWEAGIQQRSSAFAMRATPLFLDCSPRLRLQLALRPSPSRGEGSRGLGAAEARVERVAERVAEQVGAEHREADGQAREQDEPGRLLRVLRRGDREHPAPRRIGLGHAQAQEGQRGLHQDRAAELRGAEHDERAHGIGQNVAECDAHMPEADRPRRLHVLHLTDRQHARPD